MDLGFMELDIVAATLGKYLCRGLISLFAGLVITATSAASLEFKSSAAPEAGITIIEVTGRFERGDGLKLRAELNKTPSENKVVVHLNSRGGGFPEEAMSIGRLLHRTGIATVIPPKALCTSPCPVAFVGGFDRRKNEPAMTKHSTASIGMPAVGASTRKEQDYTYKDMDAAIADRQKFTLQLADYLLEIGVDIDFLKYYLKPALEKTIFISDEQLLEIGVSIYDDSSQQLIDGQALRRRRQ